MKRWLRLAVVGLFAVALVLPGCGGNAAARPSPTARPDSPPPATSPAPAPSATAAAVVGEVSAYFIRDGRVAPTRRPLYSRASPFETAVRAVVAGPGAQERSWGMSSSVPADSRLLGVSIRGDTVTVNLSKEFAAGGGSFSMTARLVQVVFAVTQFAEQKYVRFQLEGQPVTVFGGEGIVLDHPVSRADYEAWTPAILVETPTVGGTVGNPLFVAGTANTFEATFQLRLLDATGHQLVARTITAISGTGTRGSFAVQVPYSGRGSGEVVVFELSAKDGTRINEVRIPVTMAR